VGWGFFADQAPVWVSVAVAGILAFLYGYNVIVVNHEFMHTPFFAARVLRRGIRVFSSANLLYPMSLIEESHRLHHVYANDQSL
jgi:fatty acid desaturase